MIVEDVPNVIELLEVTLRFKGYAVLTARNGEEALEIIEGEAPAQAVPSEAWFDGQWMKVGVQKGNWKSESHHEIPVNSMPDRLVA